VSGVELSKSCGGLVEGLPGLLGVVLTTSLGGLVEKLPEVLGVELAKPLGGLGEELPEVFGVVLPTSLGGESPGRPGGKQCGRVQRWRSRRGRSKRCCLAVGSIPAWSSRGTRMLPGRRKGPGSGGRARSRGRSNRSCLVVGTIRIGGNQGTGMFCHTVGMPRQGAVRPRPLGGGLELPEVLGVEEPLEALGERHQKERRRDREGNRSPEPGCSRRQGLQRSCQWSLQSPIGVPATR